MISPAELEIQKRQTQAFIDADPETVVFTPGEERVSDGAGGWTVKKGTPRDPQVVRMIPTATDNDVIQSPEGRRVDIQYTVLGMPEATFERGDTFTWRGQEWKVDYLHQKPDYERKGDVVLNG